MLYNIDENIFNLIYGVSIRSDVMRSIMTAVAISSSRFFAVIFAGFLVYLSLKERRLVIPYLLSPALSVGITRLIRMFYVRSRPFTSVGIESLIYHEASPSMPSTHAAAAFAIAIPIFFINKKIGSAVLILAFITALSRVMTGVHFPLDVAAGALLAAAITFSVFGIYERCMDKLKKQ